MDGGNGFMSDINHNDVIKILTKLDEIEKEVSDIKLAQQDIAGRSKGNQEITELKLAHMEETNGLRAEKHHAEIQLINEQVQLNKTSIAGLFEKNLKAQEVRTQIKILFTALSIMAPLIITAFVYGILIYGKVKGF